VSNEWNSLLKYHVSIFLTIINILYFILLLIYLWVVIFWQLHVTLSLYNLMWCWCGYDKWCVKNIPESLRVIFRVYMFGILSITLSSIFHQGLRRSELESQISWISSLLSPPLSHRIEPVVTLMFGSMQKNTLMSHEIFFFVQMDALDSYHVSNFKFRYLKLNYVFS